MYGSFPDLVPVQSSETENPMCVLFLRADAVLVAEFSNARYQLCWLSFRVLKLFQDDCILSGSKLSKDHCTSYFTLAYAPEALCGLRVPSRTIAF